MSVERDPDERADAVEQALTCVRCDGESPLARPGELVLCRECHEADDVRVCGACGTVGFPQEISMHDCSEAPPIETPDRKMIDISEQLRATPYEADREDGHYVGLQDLSTADAWIELRTD